MAESVYRDVRVEESLRVKIGEAKNLPVSSFSGSGRNTCCAIKIDSEEIFRTSTVEKSLHPFFGAEFQGEIPKKFRCLSFYVYEVLNKTSKVLGKVSLKKEELYKFHQKEHWFPLTYQDGDTEVQGKVQLEIKLDEILTPDADTSHRLTVRVLECSDLTVINGSCNPYAVVALSYGKAKSHKEVKRTVVKKKTICPQFDEVFHFSIDNKGQNQDKTLYVFDDFMAGELSVSLFHDDSKVSREVLGNMFKGSFLGEVKIPIRDIDMATPHKAWYCLQAKEQNKTNNQSLGSIRLRISYTADYVFPSKYYNGLRNLILQSAETKPITSSAAFILGEIVNNRESAAKPLIKLFLQNGKLVPLIHAFADWEMSNTSDPNTLFRGNSLLTKMVDELMKMMGLPYLHDTLKSFMDQVTSEVKPCEIDPTRLKEGEDLAVNLSNLNAYVKSALNSIISSGLVCPSVMRDVFSTLKSRAILNYPDNTAVRYHAVTSFIFLRFFTAAILGPQLFDLVSDTPDPSVQRTLTLLSKGISGLVNVVSSKSKNIPAKEEYMAQLFDLFPESTQSDIKMFLDIISSSSGSHFRGIEAAILLKEGFMIKRAQGRKRFGLKNFKKRFFRLTNQSLSYSKNKGDKQPLFEIPITDILAVESLEEDSFKMKYMFQVVHAQRALYMQASNCLEEKEWLDILTKICKSNKNRLKHYHPAAFVNNHWLCCKSTDHSARGCSPVTGGLPLTDIQGDIDSDREVEKIHSLFLNEIDKLDSLQGYVDEDEEIDGDDTCGRQAVYSGELDIRSQGLGSHIEDPSSCFATIAEIQRCIITLEQEHIQYMRSVQRRTVIGSIDTPIGDESGADLVRNMNRSSERLSRHGSRSSNASNISRRSFRGCRSRGGSFRERDKGKTDNSGVRKSLSGDVAASGQSLGVDFKAEVKKAISYDVMAIDTEDGKGLRERSISAIKDRLEGRIDKDEKQQASSNIGRERAGADADIRTVNTIGDSPLTSKENTNLVSVDPPRPPRKSEGFIPSGVFDGGNSENFLRVFDEEKGPSRDESNNHSNNCSIISDVTNSSIPGSKDLNQSDLSFSSQNIGVLETSLEGNDIVTTTTTNSFLSLNNTKDRGFSSDHENFSTPDASNGLGIDGIVPTVNSPNSYCKASNSTQPDFGYSDISENTTDIQNECILQHAAKSDSGPDTGTSVEINSGATAKPCLQPLANTDLGPVTSTNTGLTIPTDLGLLNSDTMHRADREPQAYFGSGFMTDACTRPYSNTDSDTRPTATQTSDDTRQRKITLPFDVSHYELLSLSNENSGQQDSTSNDAKNLPYLNATSVSNDSFTPSESKARDAQKSSDLLNTETPSQDTVSTPLVQHMSAGNPNPHLLMSGRSLDTSKTLPESSDKLASGLSLDSQVSKQQNSEGLTLMTHPLGIPTHSNTPEPQHLNQTDFPSQPSSMRHPSTVCTDSNSPEPQGLNETILSFQPIVVTQSSTVQADSYPLETRHLNETVSPSQSSVEQNPNTEICDSESTAPELKTLVHESVDSKEQNRATPIQTEDNNNAQSLILSPVDVSSVEIKLLSDSSSMPESQL